MKNELRKLPREKLVLFLVMAISIVLVILGALINELRSALVCGLILFLTSIATMSIYLRGVRTIKIL